MRLATFNVENLFDRPAIMNLPTWKDGKKVLEDLNRLNDLINKPKYSDSIKSEILEIMKRNKGLLTKGKSDYIWLREIREKLTRKSKNVPVIAVEGRDDWVGWFELTTEPIKGLATENTARVIRELNADVLCMVEVEDRITLKNFNKSAVAKVGGTPFSHVMLIDGNDNRGIDVGIMTRSGYPILGINSHVEDEDNVGEIFSRDCAEYAIVTPAGNKLLMLVNHFKSKGYGSAAGNDKKRKRQATRVREIYDQRLQEGYDYIAIAGDLNDTPDSDPMLPLLADGELTDIMEHPKFHKDNFPGTHGNATKGAKLDYILMSPKLSQKVKDGGIERRGVWAGANGKRFNPFAEIKAAKDAASDHAALWVEIDI